MYRIFLTFLLFCFSVNFSFAQIRKLEKRNHSVNKLLDEILAYPHFKTADFGFLAVDINTGEIIASHHPDKSFIPASTNKLITTATTLELYGPDFQFKTTLQYTGYIDTFTHTLEGNIIIKGGGDPTLGSKYFEETKDAVFLNSWVNEIKKLGVDSVAGAVIADPGIYDDNNMPITWSWNNTGNYFGAGASGLSYKDNYYTVYFDIPEVIGDTAEIIKTEPEIRGLKFDNRATADSIEEDNTNIYGTPYSYIRLIRGELPAGKTNFGVKGSMPDPAYILACEFENALKSENIGIKNFATTLKISGNTYNDRSLISVLYSPELSDIIRETNTHSINLFSEHLIKQIGCFEMRIGKYFI